MDTHDSQWHVLAPSRRASPNSGPGFSNETVTDAFVAAFKAWASPTDLKITAEAYAQKGLYICLPPEADSKSMPKPRPKRRLPRQGSDGWWNPWWSAATGTPTEEPEPTETDSEPGCEADDGTRPHRLQLLCACGGGTAPQEACLNPLSDHIGRCSRPCFN